MRILVAGFQHETNTFAATPATYESFLNGEGFPSLRRGERLHELTGVNLAIGGFLTAMADSGAEPPTGDLGGGLPIRPGHP